MIYGAVQDDISIEHFINQHLIAQYFRFWWKQKLISRDNNNLHFYEFSKLGGFSELSHGIFTRKSGLSEPPFHGLNISLGVGDDRPNVLANREAVKSCFKAKHMSFVRQVHGTEIFTIKSAQDLKEQPPKADAMITNLPEILLAIQAADCQPVLLFDPENKVVANVHSGWKGSVENIIGKTIQRMGENFGCFPSDLKAGVGPSLGPCCAEFINYKNEIPRHLWKYRVGDNHFDFWAMSLDQLMEQGIARENIEISRMCTKCSTDLFFSFRAEKITGRFCSVIGLNQG